MIIRDTPKEIERYVLINDTNITLALQEMGFFPKYIDNNGLYFIKSDELALALKKL